MSKPIRSGLLFVLGCLWSVWLAGCGAASPPSDETAAAAAAVPKVELLVSAAASLTDVLGEIGANYESAHPGIKLVFNFGASGVLQQQIEQGAPADLFFSAAESNMKALLDKQLIDAAYVRQVVRNELVAVVPKDGGGSVPSQLADLDQTAVKTVAIGIPESVPAGAYAKQALTGAKLWEALQPKIVQAKDVRQVLAYVETGNADIGFVYRTDALISDKAKVAFAVDPSLYAPAAYPLGVVKTTKQAEDSRKLFDYLLGKEAAEVFRKYGFLAVGSSS